MPFAISVYKRNDLAFINEPPKDSTQIDAWIHEVNKRQLYSNPLGSGGMVFEYFNKIGIKMGLELISKIYNDGLVISDKQLDQLEREIQRLEDYWKKQDLSKEEPVKCSEIFEDNSREEYSIEFKEHLFTRMGFLKEAINVAKKNIAVLIIS
jgi:hypothetical protein